MQQKFEKKIIFIKDVKVFILYNNNAEKLFTNW